VITWILQTLIAVIFQISTKHYPDGEVKGFIKIPNSCQSKVMGGKEKPKGSPAVS